MQRMAGNSANSSEGKTKRKRKNELMLQNEDFW